MVVRRRDASPDEIDEDRQSSGTIELNSGNTGFRGQRVESWYRVHTWTLPFPARRPAVEPCLVYPQKFDRLLPEVEHREVPEPVSIIDATQRLDVGAHWVDSVFVLEWA